MSEEKKDGLDEQQESQDATAENLLGQLAGEKSQDVKTEVAEQQESQDANKGKDEQQQNTNDQTNEYFEDEVEELKKLGYNESDLEEFNREDVNNILQTKTEKPKTTEKEEQKPTNPQEILITKEIAEKYGGIAKNFIGQPVSELFRAIENNNKQIQKLSVEHKKLKNESTQNIEKQADEILKKIQDPNSGITEEEFNVLLKEYGELRKQAGYESAKVEVSPSEQEAEAFNQLQVKLDERLPETKVDARKAFETWWKTLDQTDQEIYAKSDARTIENALITHLELENKKAEIARLKSESENKDKDKESEARILAAEKARKAISSVQDKSISKYRIVKRTEPKRFDGLDKVVQEILSEED